uniref:Uncharacterized protein n=1 Tax=Cucumis melo TaxID=3656 RepID=A0A9I9CHH5_CUCME
MEIKKEMAKGRWQLRKRVRRTEKRAKSQRKAGTKGERKRFRHVYVKRPLLTVGC